MRNVIENVNSFIRQTCGVNAVSFAVLVASIVGIYIVVKIVTIIASGGQWCSANKYFINDTLSPLSQWYLSFIEFWKWSRPNNTSMDVVAFAQIMSAALRL